MDELTSSGNVEVILIDNHSTDNSISYLRPLFPWVKFIANETNSGYAVANNKGWKLAAGEYILFLNPDTLMAEDCLWKCIAFMENHPDAGSLGVHMIDGSGKFLPESKRGFPSPLAAFYKLSGLHSLFPTSKHFAAYYSGHLPETENNSVDVLSGAFMLVRKKVLATTGGFDEQFFMYAEDIDLSYRIKKEGYNNYYFAGTTLIHFKGESTRKDIRYVKLFYKAMILFVKKHYSGGSSFLLRLILQMSIWFSGLIAAVTKLFSGSSLQQTTAQQLLIICTNEEEHELMKILKHYPLPAILRIDPGKNPSDFYQEYAFDGIIFVAGKLSWADIITQVKSLSNKTIFRFHAGGSIAS
jgi:GT2 family glycosyltransferase